MTYEIDEWLLRCPCMETDSLGSEISIINDEIASYFGFVFSMSHDLPKEILEDLRICQRYHMKLLDSVSSDDMLESSDLEWIIGKYTSMRLSCKSVEGYIYPNGHKLATLIHIIRAKTRHMIRLVYRMEKVEKRKIHHLIEFANMLSNYYFYVALKINELKDINHEVFKCF